jgi:hypothetical protein
MRSLLRVRGQLRKVGGPTRQIIGLLKWVGVPPELLYARGPRQNASFWQRPINHLQVLEVARKLFRLQIVCVHPDKPGGNLEATILLNETWGLIQQRFKQHGHELWKGRRA